MTRLAALVLLTALTAPPAAQTEFVWKWKEGEVFYVQTTTSVKQTLVVENPKSNVFRAAGVWTSATSLSPLLQDKEIHQGYTLVSVMSYTVKRRNADGSAVVEQLVEPGRTVVKGPDSDKPETTLDGVKLILHVDAHGQVTKVEETENLLKKLADFDSGKADAIREAVSEETLKRSLSQSLGLFPVKKVKVGDTWNRPAALDLGALGKIKAAHSFKLDSLKSKGKSNLAELSFTSRMTDYQPASDKTPDLRFRVLQVSRAEWVTARGEGTALVDLNLGRPTEVRNKFTLAGFVTFRNSVIVYHARLLQEQTVAIKVMSQLPGK
jgi:hypothetical protein